MSIRVLIEVTCDQPGCDAATMGSAEVAGGSCGVSASLERVRFDRSGWAHFAGTSRALCPKHARADRAKAKREAEAEFDELVGKIEPPPGWARS